MLKYAIPKDETTEIVKYDMAGWIDGALQEYYRDRRPLWMDPRPVHKGWTPSSLGEPNDRLLVAYLLGYRGEAFSMRLRMIFDAGNGIEDQWIKRFKGLGVLESHGAWLPRKGRTALKFSGKLDAVVRHPADKSRRQVVEIKSINPGGFAKLPRPVSNPDDNYDALLEVGGETGDRIKKYLIQLQVYLYEMSLTEGVLLFDNKGTQEFREYHIDVRQDVIDKLYEHLATMQTDYWARGLLPPWNGPANARSAFATHRPNEAVPVKDMMELVRE